MKYLAFLLGIFAFSAANALADPASSRVRSAAFVELMAARGGECGLMKPWQASALRALNQEDMKRFDKAQRDMVAPEVQNLLAKHDCESETIGAWIDGASRGFDTEMLPPYLVAYKTLASMGAPPKVFMATALRVDFAAAIAAIDAKLVELEASGAKPEGGGAWSDYIEKTAGAVEGFAATLADPEATGEDADQAAAFVAQTALVIEQWLNDDA